MVVATTKVCLITIIMANIFWEIMMATIIKHLLRDNKQGMILRIYRSMLLVIIEFTLTIIVCCEWVRVLRLYLITIIGCFVYTLFDHTSLIDEEIKMPDYFASKMAFIFSAIGHFMFILVMAYFLNDYINILINLKPIRESQYQVTNNTVI